MFPDKNLSDRVGFSLAESIAMGAVLSVVSIAFLNIQKESHRNKSLVKYYEIINLTVNTIENHLIDYKKSNAFLNSLDKGDISGTSGYPVNKITVGPGNSTLKVSVSNMKGKVDDKEIKIPASPSDHLIKNRLYISDMKLFYKRKFKSAEDSQLTSGILVVSKEEEHGMIFVEISFHLNVLGTKKTIKRTASVNIVYKDDESFSRTLSPGGRIAKVLEDEVCSTKYDGIYVGKYVDGKCQGYKKFASQAVSRQICKELGGKVDGNGKCRYDFFPLLTDCPKGIQGFDAKGKAICSISEEVPSIQVALSMNNTCAIKEDVLKCWGHNTFGQVGIGGGNSSPVLTPKKVKLPTGRKAVSIKLNTIFACAILDNGELICWGKSNHTLFPGRKKSMRTPTVVVPGAVTSFVEAGNLYYHYCVTLDNNSLKCWGNNSNGATGVGMSSGTTHTPTLVSLGGDVESVVANMYNTCAILTDGTLKCWGSGSNAKLGIGADLSNKKNPVTVPLGGKARFVAIGSRSNNCAILRDNTLKCWGYNVEGGVGSGSTARTVNSPVQVNLGLGETVRSVKNDFGATCAVLNSGILKCWGLNTSGELGIGNRTNSPSPKTVNLGQRAKSVEMGRKYTCAILYDGTLKCWGFGLFGRLGIGSGALQKSPHAVSFGAGKEVMAVKASYAHTCAVLDDDTLKCWGRNHKGQLGIGDVLERSRPSHVNL